jgi:hypothetical protein
LRIPIFRDFDNFRLACFLALWLSSFRGKNDEDESRDLGKFRSCKLSCFLAEGISYGNAEMKLILKKAPKVVQDPTPADTAQAKDEKAGLEALDAPKVESGVTAPAKDEEARLAPLAPKVESADTAPAKDGEAGLEALDAPKVESGVTAPAKDEEAGAPLNFRVSAQFRREFKIYAAAHDLKLNKLLMLSFHNYRKQQGD